MVRLDERDTEEEQNHGEPDGDEAPGAAHKASQKAWTVSAGVSVGEHVKAHREAAAVHSQAADMHRAAGNKAAAEAHDKACKDHTDCADQMDAKYGNSHLY